MPNFAGNQLAPEFFPPAGEPRARNKRTKKDAPAKAKAKAKGPTTAKAKPAKAKPAKAKPAKAKPAKATTPADSDSEFEPDDTWSDDDEVPLSHRVLATAPAAAEPAKPTEPAAPAAPSTDQPTDDPELVICTDCTKVTGTKIHMDLCMQSNGCYYCTSKSDCDERVAAFGALKRKRISKVPPSV